MGLLSVMLGAGLFRVAVGVVVVISSMPLSSCVEIAVIL